MRITLVAPDGRRLTAERPYDGADHVTVDMPCPHGCPRTSCLGVPARLRVTGLGIERTTHDTHYARAVARCCEGPVGVLECEMSTIFGVREDEMVIAGPWKVY